MRSVALILSALLLASCSRDPAVAKRRYLESGNKYYERGKYKEAAIMYRNAIQKDGKFGPAYYQLGLSELKLGRLAGAVSNLRRAVELLPQQSAERADAQIKLADIFLAAAPADKRAQAEIDAISKELLKRDPNSFDGQRMAADLLLVQSIQAFRADPAKGKELLQTAIAGYRQADAVKPGQPMLRLALARALLLAGQPAEAENLYKSVLAKDKTFLLAYHELYKFYAAQKRLEEAEKVLADGLANNPKQYGFLTQLAAHYAATKRRDDMVRLLERLKGHVKEFPDAYRTVGAFYVRIGDGDQAIREYRAAIAADPDRRTQYEKDIIEVLLRQGKKAEAADMAAQILKQNPKDTDARSIQASLMLDRGEVQKAIGELQALVTSAPKNFVARYNLGRAHLAKGEVEQARQHFEAALRLQNNYLPPRVGLVQLLIARGQHDQAMKGIEEILRIDPQNAQARLLQSSALAGMKRFGDSRQLLQQMMAANPNSAQVAFQLGRVNLADGRFQEAEDAFRKAHELNPNTAQAILGVAETHMARKKADQAILVLSEEVQRNPKRVDLRLALANLAARVEKFDLALAEYQNTLAGVDGKSRSAADILLRMGEIHRRLGHVDQGLAVAQKAKEIEPNNPMILSSLALLMDGAGRKVEARQLYEHVLKLEPGNGVVLNNLAFLMAETGADLDQALTLAQRARQTLPNVNEVADTLGWIYLKKNLADNAIEIFRDLVKREPARATFRYHLGMALVQKGDYPNATRELQEALRSRPARDEEQKIKELLSKLGRAAA